MNAFHSNWTKPFFARKSGEYYIDDFELLTTILSAMKWRQFNGDIKMVTDLQGYHYYKKLGLEPIWNLGIDCTLETLIPADINPYTFWAAGKIYSLMNEASPCVMLDTDFIIWDSIQEVLDSHVLAVIHREDIVESVYPYAHRFKMIDSYQFNETFNWGVRPCNTALTYIEDENFKRFYVDESIRFMKAALGQDPLIYMVFAEQRLISMCAAYQDIEPFSFAEVDELFYAGQNLFTHVWGHKEVLRNNMIARQQFCRRCVKRILKDFPEIVDLLWNIDCLRQYVKDEISSN